MRVQFKNVYIHDQYPNAFYGHKLLTIIVYPKSTSNDSVEGAHVPILVSTRDPGSRFVALGRATHNAPPRTSAARDVGLVLKEKPKS